MNQSINQAVREMAKSVSGGHAAVAAVLIQRISGRTDFAEAVASESGGVFVALPEEANCAALAEEEISMRFLNVMEHGGEMVRKWRESTADGEVTEAELSALLAVFRRCMAEQAAVIELTRRYFCREDGACDAG